MTIIPNMGTVPYGFYKVLSHSFSFDFTALIATIYCLYYMSDTLHKLSLI